MSSSLERLQADAAHYQLALARSPMVEFGNPSRIAPVEAAVREHLRLELRNRVHGVFASAKNARSIPWAWREQRDLMYLLELDPAVVSYDAMDEQVSLIVNGVAQTHLPAFKVRTTRGQAVVDAICDRWLASQNGRRLIGAVEKAYSERGIPYVAIGSIAIRTEPRARNARWVLAHKSNALCAQAELHVRSALTDGNRTIGELEAMMPDIEDVPGVVCLMAVRRHVALDLRAAIPKRMVVSLHQGELR